VKAEKFRNRLVFELDQKNAQAAAIEQKASQIKEWITFKMAEFDKKAALDAQKLDFAYRRIRDLESQLLVAKDEAAIAQAAATAASAQAVASAAFAPASSANTPSVDVKAAAAQDSRGGIVSPKSATSPRGNIYKPDSAEALVVPGHEVRGPPLFEENRAHLAQGLLHAARNLTDRTLL
jgi:hypothetical protein